MRVPAQGAHLGAVDAMLQRTPIAQRSATTTQSCVLHARFPPRTVFDFAVFNSFASAMLARIIRVAVFAAESLCWTKLSSSNVIAKA